MTTPALLTPYTLGSYQLKNRLVMAPMTRSRAGKGNVPTDLTVEYYTQRASAGLIITEGSQVSPQGVGYANTPGIYSAEQVEGWKQVTTAIHNKGGRVFLQLWHVGRVSHSLYHNGELPVAPSAIAIPGQVYTAEGLKEYETPRALETTEVKDLVEQFRQGAINAKAAGFDGVEIHGANGYIIEQFIADGSNQRTDEYGGSIENRARLALEIVEAVVGVWGEGKVGIRFSPSNYYNGISNSDPGSIYDYLLNELNRFPLAYVHLMEPLASLEKFPHYIKEVAARYRKIYKGTIISNGGYTFEKGEQTISEGTVDLVAYGSLFLANPDLPKRFELQAALNTPDRATFYGGTEKGYTDYPFLEEEEVEISR
ncbi:alkene reductase [Rhodocytophaga rosea]|uniref:Alkene reductase n=1 Tax=Rhodocytophaga rosea TaxID=2704465 RepID=A0A6C0GEQ6_9BACT|nr:alkene reductase [Rhodocytophaga rosea]QHT66304.1 alkene reductase [Rhodocytophaga rosea]